MNNLKISSIFTIIILFLFSFTIFSINTLAHDPQAIELDYDYNNQTLFVTITHEVTNPNEHFIELVSIEKNGEIVYEEYYTSQPPEPTFTYIYEISANYGEQINVTAYCSIEGSGSATITVKSKPPNKPIINGPNKGTSGVRYEWTFIATDPENEDIKYYIDWGEYCGGYEWQGPFPSGQEIKVGHTYQSQDTFYIAAKAVDIWDSESEWAIFEISIPKQKIVDRPFFQFLKNHVSMFPIIRYILGI